MGRGGGGLAIQKESTAERRVYGWAQNSPESVRQQTLYQAFSAASSSFWPLMGPMWGGILPQQTCLVMAIFVGCYFLVWCFGKDSPCHPRRNTSEQMSRYIVLAPGFVHNYLVGWT